MLQYIKSIYFKESHYMKRLHKLLVLVLTVAMLLGVIAVSAFAADATVAKIGDVEYTSLADALAAANAVTAEEGTTPDPITIILTRSTALGAEDVISVNVPGLDLTIDLGRHNLDVSAVAASETELAKAVFYAEAQGSSLTVKNGAISSRSTDNGVFAIKDGNNTEIKIENVSVNLEGALNAPVINARSGKVTVVDSNFVTYGEGSVVVRQANDSEVLISDSTLINADGVSPLSAIFKIEGSATAKLTGETEADVRPHVSVENSEIYALANVIIGVISGDSRPIGRVSTWVSFKGCDIEQCNLSKYNAEINLLSSSNNRILKGNYCNVDFDDCDVEYARVAFETNEAQNINVKNSTFTMTNLGQTQYSNAVTGQITACPSYFVMGKGNVSVSDSMLYLAPTGTNTWAPIADSNAISYAQSLDIQESGGLEICNGTVVNTNEDLKTLKVLEIGCRAFELSKGYYIGYQSFEFDVWSDKWYTPGKYVAKLNGVKYTSFADAYVMARDGDEIRLLADVIGIVSIEKDISVINFNGYKFSHTSTSYKATATRGYTSFTPARSFELVRVILVTDSGNEEFTVAAGNYANYSREILEGWYVNGYKVVKFLGWGTTPGDYSLGTALPFIDGSNSTVKVYGAYEELYNLDADSKAAYALIAESKVADEKYMEKAYEMVNHLVPAAGYRLAKILNSIFDK